MNAPRINGLTDGWFAEHPFNVSTHQAINPSIHKFINPFLP
jgi:hypothetical protein